MAHLCHSIAAKAAHNTMGIIAILTLNSSLSGPTAPPLGHSGRQNLLPLNGSMNGRLLFTNAADISGKVFTHLSSRK